MASIQEYLLEIQTAIYGREVRGAIYESIRQCYEDVSAAKTLADTATAAANEAATAASTQATAAQVAASNAAAKASLADSAANSANGNAALASSAATAANTAAETASTAATNANNAATNARNSAAYFAQTYSSSSTYVAGEYVMYEGALYLCIASILTPEEWTASHWKATTIGEELKSHVPQAYNTDDIDETNTRRYLHRDEETGTYSIDADVSINGTDVISAITGKQDKGKVTIGSTEYTLQIGGTAKAGYITIVLE